MTFQCCNQPAEVAENIKHMVNGKEVPGVGIVCHVCGRRATGKDFPDAVKNYGMPGELKPVKDEPKKERNMNNNQPAQNQPAQNQLAVMMDNPIHLMELASPVIGADTGAVKRLVKNNVRYVSNLKGRSWDKMWNNPDGQSSIVRATEEAMILGAELGKMGDIVPYGNTCEFIPSIEAYEFALTNGKNAPFLDLTIDLIHEGDTADITRKDGSMSVNITMGLPRGEVVAVAVYGTFRDGKVLGEVYDVERLMNKALEHSSSYQYYMRDKQYAEQLRAEGKLGMQNGREFFEKEMSGSNGPWKKKIFLDELSNPYDGADKPEMLRKTAGKSFCRKFARVRNAEAAREEIKSSKGAMDRALNMADTIVGECDE